MGAIVKTPGVTEQVADYLQKQIMDGVWKPGEKISSENELKNELGVSRVSIRSGIQQLVALGILDTHQGKGTFVRAIPARSIVKEFERMYKTNKDLHDLLEYRMILETESCRMAAERISENELVKLGVFFRLMSAENEKKNRNDVVFSDNDFGFHRGIYLATGNHLIVESMERITEETQRYQRLFNTDFLCERAVYYHKRILDALKNQDGETAAEWMREHLKVVTEEHDRIISEGKE